VFLDILPGTVTSTLAPKISVYQYLGSTGLTNVLEDLNNINISGVSDGDSLVYNAGTGKFETAPVATDKKSIAFAIALG